MLWKDLWLLQRVPIFIKGLNCSIMYPLNARYRGLIWFWYWFMSVICWYFCLIFLSFFEDGPPPCSPSKVRWLKAYNKVRVQLLEVERLTLCSPQLLCLFLFLTHTHTHVLHTCLYIVYHTVFIHLRSPVLEYTRESNQLNPTHRFRQSHKLFLSPLSCNDFSTSFPLWVGWVSFMPHHLAPIFSP